MRLPLALVFTLVGTSASAAIKLPGIEPGEEVRHPVLALKGTCDGKSLSLTVPGEKPRPVKVVQGRFATLVELKPGGNMLQFRSGRESTRIKVFYRPMNSRYQVKTVWVYAADEDQGYRLAPKGGDPRLRHKLDVAMKLLQSETAEIMKAEGYGRQTFPLEFDANGKVVVHFVQSDRKGDELRAMEGDAWGHIYDLLRPRFSEESTRWVSLVGWTDYDATRQKATGHFALGGGALAAFGSGSVPHWPSRLEDVAKVFGDANRIDPAVSFEDSAGRRTVWANVSTAYGAMLHELGHALGLPHSADPKSVMSRGFDLFNRAFSVSEPPREGVPEPTVFAPDEVCRWGAYFAARLNASPFFRPETPLIEGSAPRIERVGDELRLIAPTGIRLWGAENDDTPAVWEHFKEAVPPSSIAFQKVDLRGRLKTDKPFRLTVVDVHGRWSTIDIKD